MIDKSVVARAVPFDNTSNGFVADEVQSAIEEVANAADLPIYTIMLQHNGSVGNNTFLGYNELIPGNATPVIVPRNSTFLGFTFSNAQTTADFNLEFRKNTQVGTPFHTSTKTNTQFYSEDLGTPESFAAGDQIYCKYIDTGDNASDAAVVLVFKAVA